MYFECFDGSQIEKLDFAYKGAIGGTRTVGRAQFKGSVKLRDSMIEARAKVGLVTEGMYDPAEMTKGAAMEFRDCWERHADRKIPSWFDFPFDRKMRLIKESSEGRTGRDPPYEKVWYIDDEHNVVYVRANRG